MERYLFDLVLEGVDGFDRVGDYVIQGVVEGLYLDVDECLLVLFWVFD